MSVTVVNDYKMQPGFDKNEAMAAAKQLVDYFQRQGGVQLSLWLEDKNDPLHHFHITVFDTEDDLQRARDAHEMNQFIEAYYPHMDTSSHVAPTCEVMLAAGTGVQSVVWRAD